MSLSLRLYELSGSSPCQFMWIFNCIWWSCNLIISGLSSFYCSGSFRQQEENHLTVGEITKQWRREVRYFNGSISIKSWSLASGSPGMKLDVSRLQDMPVGGRQRLQTKCVPHSLTLLDWRLGQRLTPLSFDQKSQWAANPATGELNSKLKATEHSCKCTTQNLTCLSGISLV